MHHGLVVYTTNRLRGQREGDYIGHTHLMHSYLLHKKTQLLFVNFECILTVQPIPYVWTKYENSRNNTSVTLSFLRY